MDQAYADEPRMAGTIRGGSGASIGQTAPAKSEIMQAIERLATTVERNRNKVEDLALRLNPVLGPSNPKDNMAKEREITDRDPQKIVTLLHTLADLLGSSNRTLDDVNERIQL